MTTNNNNLAVRSYVPQYSALLPAVFASKAAFSKAFAPVQVLDGISHNATAFSVKTTATPVVVGNYAKGANTGGFGTGEDGSRFGAMTEVIYSDTDATYDYELAIHEGIDRHTVNNDLLQAVADRLDLQTQAQVRKMNVRYGAFLDANAGETLELANYEDASVIALFNAISKYKVNTEIDSDLTAYVTSDLYNAVVDLASNTTAKNSSVSIDTNGVVKYKGTFIEETADAYFTGDTIAYVTANSIVIPFVGIEEARTIEATQFSGVEIQASSKGGAFILDDNKKAIIKVTTVPVG